MKGPPLRAHFENAVFKLRHPTKTRQGCAARPWKQTRHLFQTDTLPWALNFLSGVLELAAAAGAARCVVLLRGGGGYC